MKGKFNRVNEILTSVRLWTVNLLTLAFLVYVIVIVVSIVSRTPATVDPEGRVLIIAPEGVVVDQEVVPRTIEFPGSLSEERQIQYRDLVRLIRAAAQDARLQAVSIDFSNTRFSGLTTLLGIAGELARLRETGKPLIAYSEVLTTGSYLLASQAEEVYVHPSGAVAVSGLGGYRPFLRGLLDKLSIELHEYSQGDYKSAGEMLTRESMSDADRQQTRELLFPLWEALKAQMAAGRSIEPAVFQRLADEYPVEVLPEAAYPNLQFALAQGVIDGTMTFPEYRAWMMERFGVDEEADAETYPHITAGAYFAQLEEEQPDTDQSVAVVFAQGLLTRGEHKPGIAGADDIARLLRSAYEDEDTQAIVLRVSSPGGMVLASELVHEELQTARGRGLPVVVSMGDVAASGGMWVSAPADRIYAMPTTITGSIGVALVIPTAVELFEKGGISFDGMATSEYAGWDIHQPIDEKLDAVFEQHTAGVYQRFIEVVAEGRGRTQEEIRNIAGGRVWLGTKALEVGLVDELGDLDDAVAAAAAMAELDDYRVEYVSVEVPFGTRLLRDLMGLAPLRMNPVFTELNGVFGPLLERFTGVTEPRVEVLCGACLFQVD